jgi:hypothetical protein
MLRLESESTDELEKETQNVTRKYGPIQWPDQHLAYRQKGWTCRRIELERGWPWARSLWPRGSLVPAWNDLEYEGWHYVSGLRRGQDVRLA